MQRGREPDCYVATGYTPLKRRTGEALATESEMVKDAREQLSLVFSFFPPVDAKLSTVLAVDTAILATMSAAVPTFHQITAGSVAAAILTAMLLVLSFLSLYRGGFPDTKGGHSSVRFAGASLAQLRNPFQQIRASQTCFRLHGLCSPTLGFALVSLFHSKAGPKRGCEVMAILDDLKASVEKVVTEQWTHTDGRVVPGDYSLALSNDRVEMEAAVLYADLADSTEIAIASQVKAAEIFKTCLQGTTRLTRANDGHIRSFDGDRVMGVFIGDNKNSSAAKCGLQINWFFKNLLASGLKSSMAMVSHPSTSTRPWV